MASRRVLRTAAAILDHTFYAAGAEVGTNSSVPVAVTVTDANDAPVITGGTATQDGPTGRYVFALPGQPLLQALTVTWQGTIAATAMTETDLAEVVGGYLFSLAEGRASDPVLASTSKYPTERLRIARDETEAELEEICDRAFVPRYRRAVVDGTGTTELLLPDSDVRTVRAARVAPAVGEAFVALTGAELAKLAVRPGDLLTRGDGRAWTAGLANVIVEYEYGLTVPPADLRRAALRRFRYWAGVERSGIPDRAVSYTTAEGASYRLSQPGPYTTGIPDVDAVYGRYSRRERATGADGAGVVPASRQLNYDPQRYSLFHGGIQ